MALLRARPAAGDRTLGERALAIVRRAALAAPIARDESSAELRRIRERVERELSAERPGVYDVKLGRGGLLDIEFVVQFLQVSHGEQLGEALWAEDTLEALAKLAEHRLLPDEAVKSLLDGWTFLRRLELRARVARADGAHVVDARGPELGVLARRKGMRGRAGRTAEEELVGRIRETTERVRAVFDDVVGRSESP
jgi:glutamate-ammonia-ligase adenylyltransferase